MDSPSMATGHPFASLTCYQLENVPLDQAENPLLPWQMIWKHDVDLSFVFFLCCYFPIDFAFDRNSGLKKVGGNKQHTKALFTWLLYSFGQLPIVVVPTVLSAILALVPKVSPVWSVSFWAAVYLWLHSQKICAALHLTSREGKGSGVGAKNDWRLKDSPKPSIDHCIKQDIVEEISGFFDPMTWRDG